jgi:predicted GNAT family acetyltransferase
LGGGFPIIDFTGIGTTSPSNNTNNNLNSPQLIQFNLTDINNTSTQSNTFYQNQPGFINTHSSQPSQNLNKSSDQIKQIFKNNEIVVYSSSSKSVDKSHISCCFYVSNNLDKMISNVKLNLSVKKHVNCKVLSTSGTTLEPMKSMGIKKVNYYK